MEVGKIIKKGIGEKVLEKKNLAKTRVKIFDDILRTIDTIKQSDNDNSEEANRSYNNFISILGGRGSGKSSMILTILDDLKNSNRTLNNNLDNEMIPYDTILNTIDPLMFNLEKNALGWIIYSFDESINKIKNLKNNAYCNEVTKAIDELEKKYSTLTQNYIISRDFYRNNLAALSEGRIEYKKVNEEIIKADLNLEKAFKIFIETYIETIKKILKNDDTTTDPYIIISFDDIDIRPQYGPEILDTIIKYLKHKNIIVIISGEYTTFKESLFIDLWRKQDVPEAINIKDVLIDKSLMEQVLQRADDILNKVMPPAYSFELEGLSLFERLTYTPYGYDGTSIAKMLSKFTIGKEESENTESLLDYFIKPLINTSEINKEITNMKERKKKKLRLYNGFDYDIKHYEDNETAIRCYKALKKLYVDNDINDDEIEKAIGSSIEEIKSYLGIESSELSENEKEKMLLKSITLSNTGELLPDTPRGLINLYHSIYLFILKSDDYNNDFLYLNKNINNILGQGVQRNLHIDNFNNIVKLLNIFKECNIDLRYKDNKKILTDVIKIDSDNKTIYFNFSEITFKSNEFYYNKIINITESIKVYNNKKIELPASVFKFIELAYDLAKSYLIETYVKIENDKDLSKIIIYNRDEDKIQIESEDFNTFREFYEFQSMYKILIPLIVKDLRVHRNIRDRLRVYLYNSLYSIMDKNDEKSDLYKYKYEITKLKDITTSKESHDNKDKFFERYEEYYDRYLIKPVDSDVRNQYKTAEFILFFKEKNDYVFETFKNIIDDEKLVFYNNVCKNFTSSKTYVNRYNDIVSLVESYSQPLKYYDRENNLKIQIERINELISKDKNKEKEIINENWSEIANQIIVISSILVGNIIIRVDYANENKLDNEIKQDMIALLDEFKELIRKVNPKGNNKGKINKDIKIIFKDLTGLEFDNVVSDIKFEKIRTFLSENDYWTEKCQKYIVLLEQIEGNITKTKFEKYLDEEILSQIDDDYERNKIEMLHKDIETIDFKKEKSKVESLIKDFINTKNIN